MQAQMTCYLAHPMQAQIYLARMQGLNPVEPLLQSQIHSSLHLAKGAALALRVCHKCISLETSEETRSRMSLR